MRTTKGRIWIHAALCVCLTLALALSGLTPVQAKTKGYKFKYKKVTITPGGSAAKFLKKAGKYKATKAKSCATEGYDYTYTYDKFVLTTYTKTTKKNAKQYVNSIRLTSSKVKTSEGIKIGSTEKKVKKKYKGASYSYGVYTKTKGSSKIVITVDNGKVTDILICKK